MVFYSFFTTWNRTPGSLVFRTNSGWSEFQADLKMFPQKEGEDGAEKDFMKILWDNPEFRVHEYIDTSKGNKKASPQKKATVEKPSDIPKEVYEVPSGFKIDLNTIYNMDVLTFTSQVPDKYVDYVFTSPPYNIGKRTSFGKNNSIYAGDEGMYAEYKDGLSPEEYKKWLNKVVEECLRVTKKHVFFNIQMLAANRDAVLDLFHIFRANLKEVFIWNKTIASPNLNKKVVTSAFEFIFCFSNDKPHLRSFDDSKFDGTFRNVITGVNSSQNKFKELNKATFPLYLPQYFMHNFGKAKDIWFEPFNGTGTTPHAAILEDKYFLATELDPKQVDATNARIDDENFKIKFNFNQEFVDEENRCDFLVTGNATAKNKRDAAELQMGFDFTSAASKQVEDASFPFVEEPKTEE